MGHRKVLFENPNPKLIGNNELWRMFTRNPKIATRSPETVEKGKFIANN